MRESIEQPDTLVDVTGLPLDEIEELPGGGVRIGARVRNSAARRASAGPRAVPGAVAGAAQRRLGAAAQHGHRRRQPAAAHALPVLLRRGLRLQQARAWQRLRRDRRASTATTRSSAPSDACIATHPSDMCVALAALDAVGRGGERPRRPARPADRASTACPATPRTIETDLAADELITAVELPPRRRRALPLPQGARPRVLRLRARLRRRRAGGRATAWSTEVRLALGGVAPKPWRASEAERVLRGAPATEESFRARRRGRARARRRAARTTPSRSSWPAARSPRR